MTFTVRISSRAWEQVKQAALYYEDQREGLGQEFLEAFRETTEQISDHPRIYAVKFDAIRSVKIKHFKPRKKKRIFRYIALYEIVGDQIPIYAVIGVDTEDSDPDLWGKFKA